ncbi:hypothetical protein LR48_Vigan10g025200 [Vigna angularis]|uniref:Cytochrome P450 n=1 Tax=Phaseolus angularis TaxID=3914 RepID=A0A0L9VH09_PHAAN|nr:cytochrome P450 CYP94D108 [Vigna angularis]KAG2405498.1 Cytochrome P450 [Vigna angularis]KOM54360.1 hypothetical protein LR48_Vigan10g025200 [Vigna angularis]
MEFLSFLFLALLFVLSLYFAREKPHNNKCFRPYPLIGGLLDFLKNRHRFLEWTTQVLNDCPTNTAVMSHPYGFNIVVTANPDNVEHMLKTRFENYPKGERFIHPLHDLLGNGIFNSDSELWKVQRKVASYEFTTNSLRNFIVNSITTELQTRLLPILSKASQTNRVLDLQNLLERFSFDNICKLAFNVDPACLGGDCTAGTDFMSAFEDATKLISERFLSLSRFVWKTKKLFNFGSERRLRESITTVHEFADSIIRSRLEAKEHTRDDEDLLSRFIRTKESSPEFLRDVVISFILAGRDSTSSALTWFFWILSSRPHVRRKIRDEIARVRSATGGVGPLGHEELREMHYLHAAISESMRLYPPVPVDTKECLNDDVLPDGTRVGKGWLLTYHTYAMGRMESVWGKDCTKYNPERWLQNGVCRMESPFRFPVFHAGPRMCLGKEMAYVQMKSIAASVVEKFEIEAADRDTCPAHSLSLTLKMKGGFPVRVRLRDAC